IDQGFFSTRINQAHALRARLLATERLSHQEATYRVVHSEGDGLPGLIVDRYGDAVALQMLTAGMERRRDLIVTAVEDILQPRLVVARNDSPMREREGLTRERILIRGDLPAERMVMINGLHVAV